MSEVGHVGDLGQGLEDAQERNLLTGPPRPLAQATTTQPKATLHASLDSISYTQASKVLQGGNMYLLFLRRWEIPKTHSQPMVKATSQSTTLVVWNDLLEIIF